MRSMEYALALVAVGASTILPLGCSRPTPVPPSVPRDSATALSVFRDTALYRRHCVVPAGQPVDLTQPCLLLEQGLQLGPRPPAGRPPTPRLEPPPIQR
jgi:hypothetical protein